MRTKVLALSPYARRLRGQVRRRGSRKQGVGTVSTSRVPNLSPLTFYHTPRPFLYPTSLFVTRPNLSNYR
jgi:hypothetical protein